MQRSITHKNNIRENLIYIFLFIIYQALSSIYLFLPPLFGVLFILLIKALNNKNSLSILFISFCLVVFEADKGYMLFSSIIYLLLIYKFILPSINQTTHCLGCINFSSIVLAYIGFYLTNTLFASIFLMPIPELNYYIVYYIVIEFLIVSLL